MVLATGRPRAAAKRNAHPVSGQRRATSFDIAQLAGVSQPTVSRALHGGTTVSRATRQRVEAIARRLNYSVDRSAATLQFAGVVSATRGRLGADHEDSRRADGRILLGCGDYADNQRLVDMVGQGTHCVR